MFAFSKAQLYVLLPTTFVPKTSWITASENYIVQSLDFHFKVHSTVVYNGSTVAVLEKY